MRIAILGAPGSGPSALADQLRHRLQPAPAFTVMEVQQLASGAATDWGEGLVALGGTDLILLMGLASNCQAEQRAADHALRATLQRRSLPYALVYGTGPQRCESALQAIHYQQRSNTGPRPADPLPADLPPPPSRWHWPCEKCSDPQCEHRLFSELLKSA